MIEAESDHHTVYGGGREYWNARYAQPKYVKHKDWYCEYPILRRHALAVFAPYLPLPAPSGSAPRLLVVGCGNSSVSAGLYEDGYTNIVNIDISDVIIRQMTVEHSERYPLMTYAVMDVSHMDFDDESFDLVLDKGTLDAVCCGPQCFEFVHEMCSEIWRVMRTGGQYVCISYGPPFLRRHYLLKDELKHKVTDLCLVVNWRLEERKITLNRDEQVRCLSVLEDDESGTFYVYICTKLSPEEQQERVAAHLREQSERVSAAKRKEEECEHEDEDDGEGDDDGEYDDADFKVADFLENPLYKQNHT
ncbi:methyltransferase domain containing protein [Acanthamoeba castellanii str. Neff]|uniref:Methyltransferase domain containing protein n=1 Tax=Acanthamoeba castellanii (strain ATCC 30010 / Neff) TaxID=1257118 RepID=L8GH92_ACACF|nr:methyltransferase domain containing protein [Acanthamoeba castellanii str. Neff]ELR12088.1 methyltransferase domain containing protein [Acanthamoeba castellanii str. Neff]